MSESEENNISVDQQVNATTATASTHDESIVHTDLLKLSRVITPFSK